MSYLEHAAADARLVILKALSKQVDGRLNEVLITAELDSFGHKRSREWVRTQLNKLEELGAVVNVTQGTVVVAAITRLGVAHVERREVIDGVARPSPEF